MIKKNNSFQKKQDYKRYAFIKKFYPRYIQSDIDSLLVGNSPSRTIGNLFWKNLDWKFIQASIEDDSTINKIFLDFNPQIVIHLAAQAGVRYSIKNPKKYIHSNITGFFNVIDICRALNVQHFVKWMVM